MDMLLSKSLLLFIGILLILVLAALFPSPLIVSSLTLFGSLLIIYQTIIVLKDDK